MDPVLPVILAFLAVIAALVVALFFVSKKRRKVQNALFDKLSSLGATGSGFKRELPYEGLRVTTNYYYPGKNRPGSFSLSVELPTQCSFTLRSETSSDEQAEDLGLASDIVTGDPQFDKRYHVDTDDTEFASAYFASPKKREALYALIAAGWGRLNLDEGRLQVDWDDYSFEEKSDTAFVAAALPHLAVLASELPETSRVKPAEFLSIKAVSGFFGLALSGAFFGFVALRISFHQLEPIDSGEFFLATLPYTGTAWAVLVILAARLLKGKTWFLGGLSQAAIATAVLLGVGGYWGGVYWNASRCAAPPAPHATVVTHKHVYRGKNSPKHYVHLRSWRRDGDEVLEVSRHVYELADKGCAATVYTKPGALSYGYITDMSFDCSRGR